MKNFLMILTTVFVFLFSAATLAMGQRSNGRQFEDHFGRIDGRNQQRGGVAPATAGSTVSEEEDNDPLDLSFFEIARAFTEKGFTISSKKEDAIKDFRIVVKVFSHERSPRVGGYGYYYRYYYHREPESVIFVSLENTDGDTKIIGRGDNTNIRKAAEEAAKNAAKKLKKMLGDEFKPIIFIPLPE